MTSSGSFSLYLLQCGLLFLDPFLSGPFKSVSFSLITYLSDQHGCLAQVVGLKTAFLGGKALASGMFPYLKHGRSDLVQLLRISGPISLSIKVFDGGAQLDRRHGADAVHLALMLDLVIVHLLNSILVGAFFNCAVGQQ